MKSPNKTEKSFGDFFALYFQAVCSRSTMHGASFLCNRKLFFWEKILWFLIMLFGGIMIFNWTALYIVRHIERPTIMSLQRDHLTWETFFPVFTICAEDKVNETALDEFIRCV